MNGYFIVLAIVCVLSFTMITDQLTPIDFTFMETRQNRVRRLKWYFNCLQSNTWKSWWMSEHNDTIYRIKYQDRNPKMKIEWDGRDIISMCSKNSDKTTQNIKIPLWQSIIRPGSFAARTLRPFMRKKVYYGGERLVFNIKAYFGSWKMLKWWMGRPIVRIAIVVIFVSMITILGMDITFVGLAGTAYYVSHAVGASDSNNGLYPVFISGTDGPWLTHPKAMGDVLTYLLPGDTLSFRCGDTWTDMENGARQARSGNAGNIITIGSYSTGAKPIWDWGGYVGYTDFRCSYIRITGIEIDGGSTPIAWTEGAGGHFTNIEIDNMKMHDSNNTAIGLGEACGISYFNGHDCEIYDAGLPASGCAMFVYGDATYHGTNNEMHDNNCYHNQGDTLTFHDGHSDRTNHLGANQQIYNNIIKGTSIGGECIDTTSGDTIYVYGNECTVAVGWETRSGRAFATDNSAVEVYFYLNYCHDLYASGGMVTNTGAHLFYCYCNVLEGTANDFSLISIVDDNQYHDAVPAYGVYHVLINKNTFIWNGGSHCVAIADVNSHIVNCYIEYNCFTTNGSSAPSSGWIELQNFGALQFSGIDIDYNVYGPGTFSADDRGTSRNWTYWTGTLGKDANGYNGDPGMVDRPGKNYNLLVTSPARGKGPGTGLYQPDMNGTPTDIDAGAYEYLAGTGTLVITNVSINNMVFRSR